MSLVSIPKSFQRGGKAWYALGGALAAAVGLKLAWLAKLSCSGAHTQSNSTRYTHTHTHTHTYIHTLA
jgi:hypothetical protein